MSILRLLGIAGSLRRASANKGLLRAAQAALPVDTTLEIADLLDVPFYNADLTEIPAAVQRIARQAQQADGFVFACTELQLLRGTGFEEHPRLAFTSARQPAAERQTGGADGCRRRYGNGALAQYS